MFEWDETKRRSNLIKHGLDFESVWDMDWSRALRIVDARRDYGEQRYVALVPMGRRLCCCAYTERGNKKRIISLRKANAKEVNYYEEKIADDE